MIQSKQAQEMIDLMGILDEVNVNEEGMIKNPNQTSGPGAKKRSTPNDYTRDDIAKMLDYAKQYVIGGNQQDSWEYDQNWLNMVGDALKQFMTLKSGDPALGYEMGKMQGDMQNRDDYGDISFGKADKGKYTGDMKSDGPGPRRGRKMDKEYDHNKMAKKMGKKMVSHYNRGGLED